MRYVTTFIILAALTCIGVLGYVRWDARGIPLTARVETCAAATKEKDRYDCFQLAMKNALRSRDGSAIMHELSAMSGWLCHEPAHALGRQLMQKYGSIETALNHCTQECSGGCLHGIIGEALAEVPGIKLSLVELRHPNEQMISEYGARFCHFGAEACHGVGHILFQLYGDFDDALEKCDEFALDTWHAQACERGVFMENNLPVSMRGPISGTPRRVFRDNNDLLFPCTVVSDRYKAVCYHFLGLEQEYVFTKKGIVDPAEKQRSRFDACTRLSERTLYLACIEGAAYWSSPSVDCSRLAGADAQAICVYGVAKGMAAFDKYDPVLRYCTRQTASLSQEACYQSYFSSLRNREVRPLQSACAGSSDDACARLLQVFIARPIEEIYLRLTGQ